MKQRFSSYPIGELILQTFIDSGLKLPEFVRAIGYSNEAKGIATLDHWLQKGSGNPIFLERLTSSRHAPEPAALRSAISATETILAEERKTEKQRRVEEERASFYPFVQGIAELSRPTSITMFAVTGGPSRYTVKLPLDIRDWPVTERDAFLKDVITENYALNNGKTLFMGKITGYLFFSEYGAPPTRFSCEGISLGVSDARPVGEATLTINGRPIPQGLFAIQSMRS